MGNMAVTTEYQVNKGQISRIHALLAKVPGLGDKKEMAAYKKNLVRDYTDGRETSTTKLSWKEANDVIAALERVMPVPAGVITNPTKKAKVPGGSVADKKRKKLLHYCHLMGWYKGIGMQVRDDRQSVGDVTRQARLPAPVRQELDMERVDGWCITYGKYKKALMEHDAAELSILIIQMEKVYEAYLNAV